MNGQKKAISIEGARVESLEFFHLARKVIYTNLFTKHSPNSQLSFEQKVKKDDEDPQSRFITYLDVSLR